MSGARRWAGLAVSLLGLLWLSGCWIPSVNPLYEDSDLVSDQGLVGTWQAEDSKTAMTFTRDAGGKCYDIVYEENDGKSNFSGCVAQLGKARYLDIKPAAAKQPDALSAHLLPLHSFWKMELQSDRLILQALNAEWFKEMDTKKRLQLEHFESEEDIVLTASTASLRSFFLRNGGLEGVFGEKTEFHRQK